MNSNNTNIYISLAVLMGVSILFMSFFSVLATAIVIIVLMVYSLFYTTRPKSFWLFYGFGISLTVLNLTHPYPLWISIFSTVSFLECARVLVMAMLRYPSTIQDLKQLTEDLERRVSQRTAELTLANEQLRKANEELQQLDQMKTAFVSQASHDLRTPLTAIKGSLDNLKLGVAGELTEKQTKILQRALRSVDRLTLLINDILDLNRIESGRTVLEKDTVSISTILENVVREQTPAAQAKKIHLHFMGGHDPCRLELDAGKIERVIGELTANAIKYTPEGGTVEVSLQTSGDQVFVQVRDTGLGLDVDECGKIWDRFYRAKNATNFAKGSGLGLSIAKELVEMHEGTLTVDSSPGRGSTFTMTLPCVPPKPVERMDRP